MFFNSPHNKREHMSGKKHLMVVASQVQHAEKAHSSSRTKEPEQRKADEPAEVQVPLDGDVPIFTEEFLNYNKGRVGLQHG